MTVLNTEIPAEKREDELTPDELKVVSGGWLAWSAWASPTTEVIGGRNKTTDAHANMKAEY